MERFKQIKEALIGCIQAQVGQGLKEVDTKELGEAIDMLKDMEEAMYYCSIVKAMEESKEEEKYKEKFFSMNPQYNRMMYSGEGKDNMPHNDKNRMYYDGGGNSSNSGGSGNFHDWEHYPYPAEIRDYREGKSPITRRTYLESKEMHHEKSKQMQELEKYAKELTEDILEMVNGASPEERQILSQKLTALAGKVNNV